MSAHLIEGVAKQTGVASGDVKKVLEHLGLNALVNEVDGVGSAKDLKVSQLKLAARLGKSSVAV